MFAAKATSINHIPWSGKITKSSAYSHSGRKEAARFEIVGFGVALAAVVLSPQGLQAAVDDEFLEKIGIEKGGRRIISLEERAQILELLDGQYQVKFWLPTFQ